MARLRRRAARWVGVKVDTSFARSSRSTLSRWARIRACSAAAKSARGLYDAAATRAQPRTAARNGSLDIQTSREIRNRDCPAITAGQSGEPLFHHDHFLRVARAVDDELVQVHARSRLLAGTAHVAVPVGLERAPSGVRARELEVVELLADALQNGNRDELCQHVVNLQRNHRPVTVGE